MKGNPGFQEPSMPEGVVFPYGEMLDALGDPVVVADAAGAIRYANQAFSESFTCSPAASFFMLLPEAAATEFRRRLSLCVRNGSAFLMESRLFTKDAQTEYFQIRCKRIKDHQGAACFVLHLRCITDIVLEKRENAERERRYQALAEQASEAFFVHDFNGRFVEVNDRACKSLGYTREELLTMSVPDVEQDFDLQSAQAEWVKIQPGSGYTLNGRHKRKDGTLFPAEVQFGCCIWRGERLYLSMARDITRRRTAEERFRRIVEGAPDPIFVQTDNVFVYINPACCRLFGIATPEGLLGTPVLERIPPESRRQVTKRIRQLNMERKPVNELFEQEFIRVDGSRVWVETKGEPIEYDGKHGALVFVRDVSERRKAARELHESEAFNRAVMDNLPIGIAVNSVSPLVDFAYMNDRFPLYYGTSREKLMDAGMFWDAVYEDPAFREEIKARVLDDASSGDPKRMAWENIPIRRKGEETRYISAYNTPVPGSPLMISTVMDVTSRIQAEQQLKKQAERLEILHEIDRAVLTGPGHLEDIAGSAVRRIHDLLNTKRASIDIFVMDGKDLRVQAVDTGGKAAVNVQTMRLKEKYGNLQLLQAGQMDSAEDIAHKVFPSHVKEYLQGMGVCSFLLVPLKASGQLIGTLSLGWDTPRAFLQEEKDIAQEVASQLAIVIERSRMRGELALRAEELEERVRKRTEQYEAANKELEAFSYSVSHDLRAPLRSVDGYVQILLEDYSGSLDENGKRVCHVISDSARQMGRLIDDLLAFSRVGRADLRRLPVDMEVLVHAIYHELTTEEERASFDVTIGPLPGVMGDPTLMRQVWVNLLSNAIKFSSKKEKTVIRVSGTTEDGKTVYQVADEGAGFDQRYADKLFGVFQRLHSSREFEGTGVGLAIVQRIVNRHGGTVWAEGRPGEGATFYFSVDKGEKNGSL